MRTNNRNMMFRLLWVLRFDKLSYAEYTEPLKIRVRTRPFSCDLKTTTTFIRKNLQKAFEMGYLKDFTYHYGYIDLEFYE